MTEPDLLQQDPNPVVLGQGLDGIPVTLPPSQRRGLRKYTHEVGRRCKYPVFRELFKV